MKKSLQPLLTSVFTALVSVSASAALPQPGSWGFDAELNGQPGRGLQIDRQGGTTIIVSYYGYRADGSATFYQASGKIADDYKTFSADLNEYKNGPVLGGAVRSGELAKTMGTVKIEFDTTTTASITLPGEKTQAISLFSFDDYRNRLNNQFNLTAVELGPRRYYSRQSQTKFHQAGDALEFNLPIHGNTTPCAFKGDLVRQGAGFTSNGSYVCTFTSSQALGNFKLTGLQVDHLGFLSATIYTSPSEDLNKTTVHQLFGICSQPPQAVILGIPGTGDRCSADKLGVPELMLP